MIYPTQGTLTGRYGDPRTGHSHQGADFAAPAGTPVVAAAAGTVRSAFYSSTGGNMVIVDHGGGLETRYLHLSRSVVVGGQNVSEGSLIGHVGNTGSASRGNHLHFEVRINGAAVDPLPYLTGAASPVGNPLQVDLQASSAPYWLLGLAFIVLLLRR